MNAYPCTMKATLLIAAAAAAAIACPAPATAFPPYPVPFIDHDGTYVVGKDIRPGLYLTQGTSGGGMCSWSRLSSDGSTDASNVIDRGRVKRCPVRTYSAHRCGIRDSRLSEVVNGDSYSHANCANS